MKTSTLWLFAILVAAFFAAPAALAVDVVTSRDAPDLTSVRAKIKAKDYQAAVLSAGFCSISLGSTPTAIATMTAVTKHYGSSPNAFVVLPLVSALFVSLINVAVITLFLSL